MTWKQRPSIILVMVLVFFLSTRSSKVSGFQENETRIRTYTYEPKKTIPQICDGLAEEIKNFEVSSRSLPWKDEGDQGLRKWFKNSLSPDDMDVFLFYYLRFEKLLLNRMNLSMEKDYKNPSDMSIKHQKILALGVLQMIVRQPISPEGSLIWPEGYRSPHTKILMVPKTVTEQVTMTYSTNVPNTQISTSAQADPFDTAISQLSFVSLRSTPDGAKVTYKGKGKTDEELDSTNSEIWLARGIYEFSFVKDGVRRTLEINIDKDIEKINVKF